MIKINNFSDADGFIVYIDERLILPKTLPPIIMRSLHYGQPGRDSMLVTVSNVGWLSLHRDVVIMAKACTHCHEAVQNKKHVHRQTKMNEMPICT